MYTSKSVTMLKKAECLLEMLANCNKRIESYKQMVESYDWRNSFHSEMHFKSQYQRYMRIKQRIVTMYGNMLVKLVNEAISQSINPITYSIN